MPVGRRFADGNASDPSYVARHSWTPLIHYVKKEKRYKRGKNKTIVKCRDIMYASHKDSCILSKYNYVLSIKLEEFYQKNNLMECAIAYRKLGKANYNFSAEVFEFCMENAPCVVLCFDVTGFYDNLNHNILKERIKKVMNMTSLPDDLYKVFRYVTSYSNISRENLNAVPKFQERMKNKRNIPIATIQEIKEENIKIDTNVNKFGIPQGTPISSSMSNVYMIDLDRVMRDVCIAEGALYRRYSDDIIIVCKHDSEDVICNALANSIAEHRLVLKEEKTERTEFDKNNLNSFQYLGFSISSDGAIIRSNSLGRQWRKLKRGIRKARRDGENAIRTGKSEKIYTKKLWKKFSPVGVRNFSHYARNATKAFRVGMIKKQIRRLERRADAAIRDLARFKKP